MVLSENQSARTAVTVQGQLVILPEWLVEGASERGIDKAIALLEGYRHVTHFHIANSNIVAHAKGSKGDTYLVKVSIWNKEKGETPKLLTCSCPHGIYGGKGICYHKIALILKVLLTPGQMYSRPIPKYEDDYELE
ncbi:MAG: SWIM zinc finger family protein [Candidatus Heimdallarchaeota archaeon]